MDFTAFLSILSVIISQVFFVVLIILGIKLIKYFDIKNKKDDGVKKYEYFEYIDPSQKDRQ